MSPSLYLGILRSGLYGALLIIFLVKGNFLFPYITSKQIPFNILMEALLPFWVALIVKYPEYRPKRNYITTGIAAFLGAITLSSLFGVDFNLSFWGDIERMLGVFHVMHFFLFYLYLVSVMRSWLDWKWFLNATIAVGFVVNIIGLTGTSYATIGNIAYVAGMIIINFFLTLMMMYKEKSSWRWLYLLPVFVMLKHFVDINISGAFVGLFAGLVAMSFLFGVLSKNKRLRYGTLASSLLIVFIFLFLVINRQSDFVKSTSLLQPFTEIDFQKNTFQTRLISWRAALRDLPNHLLFGTGFGNFAITFDKFFEAKFYTFTAGETYFDRAHNNVIDIVSTSGIVGLATYLSIFLAAAYYLIFGYRRGLFSAGEFAVISGLIVAYFVQNLAVFDSYVTYLGIMTVLAYIHWSWHREETFMLPPARSFDPLELYTFGFVAIASLLVMYPANIQVWHMLDRTIYAQQLISYGQVEAAFDAYKEAHSADTVLDRDSRQAMNRAFVSSMGTLISPTFNKEKAMQIAQYNIEMAERNVAYNKSDSLNLMMLSQVYSTASQIAARAEQMQLSQLWYQKTMESIDRSIASSPKRVQVYFQKAQFQLARGDKDGGLATLQYAYDLNPEFNEASCHIARANLYFNQVKEAQPYLDKCIDLEGSGFLNQEPLLQALVADYEKKKDWPRVAKLQTQLTVLLPKEAKHWVKLAKAYGQMGDKDKASSSLAEAVKLDKTLEREAKKYYDSIK